MAFAHEWNLPRMTIVPCREHIWDAICQVCPLGIEFWACHGRICFLTPIPLTVESKLGPQGAYCRNR